MDQESQHSVKSGYIWPALSGPVWLCLWVCILRCLPGRFPATIVLVSGEVLLVD